MVSKRYISHAVIILGALAAAVACGTTVAAEPAGGPTVITQHVVQDPDNPAARNYVAPVGDGHTSIVRDPENPSWSGFNAAGVGSSSGSLGLR
jgi:hypothetical protein